jgi:hypothetical protein
MSAQEIIAELPSLSRPDLQQVDARLRELLRGNDGSSAKSWGEALLEVAGAARNLPADFAHNHDHYLHGARKR